MGALKAFGLCAVLVSGPQAGLNCTSVEQVSLPLIDRWQSEIAQASRRFAIPAGWIRAVMKEESAGLTTLNGRPITSSAGAMGLMQLMPGTWSEMRDRYGFGRDPYDPHDNIMAGAAYLREMYDRYGAAGFLAAYNAGPGRYEAHLIAGRPLPLETRAYVAKIASRLGDDVAEIAAARSLAPPQSTLFIPVGVRSADLSAGAAAPPTPRRTAAASPLFATVTAQEPGR